MGGDQAIEWIASPGEPPRMRNDLAPRQVAHDQAQGLMQMADDRFWRASAVADFFEQTELHLDHRRNAQVLASVDRAPRRLREFLLARHMEPDHHLGVKIERAAHHDQRLRLRGRAVGLRAASRLSPAGLPSATRLVGLGNGS